MYILGRIIMGLLGLVALIIIFGWVFKGEFNDMVTKEVGEFFAGVDKEESQIIKEADLANLPEPVQRWLEYAQVIGKEQAITARSKQEAVMRLKAEQDWMPLESDQYFRVDEPGFIWKADVKMMPLVHISGRDKYYQGKGNMLIKVLSMFTVANGIGLEMDQGSLVRYLAEIVWVPSAALRDYITWEEIDEKSAKATMTYKGVSASGIFSFDEEGAPVSFLADRYGDFEGQYILKPWLITMSEYQEFNGIRIPTEGEVTWKLEEGDFTWYRFRVKEIEYNKAELY